MSKKKNTLKDLDEFLKQQAATLVAPARLSDRIEEKPVAQSAAATENISLPQIEEELKSLSIHEGPAFRNKFYDLIIKLLEAQSEPRPEDKLLINTALYLKSGDNWKEAIRDYWRKNS
ncbi:MAG: hypothetical protein HC859_05935 [Bacteroidia bacterium]|nr:hypothetical protein [Bacteroidia bacterium]